MSTPDASTEPSSPLVRVKKALGRVRRRLQPEVFDVFIKPVLDEHREFEAPEGYDVRWMTADEVAACEEYHTELDLAQREDGVRRLGLGHRVVGAFAGDLCVFSMWENPGKLNVPGLMKRALAPHQSFIYKAFTSPDHRGRKLYQAGMRFILSELQKGGKTELVGYAHVDKKASRGGMARVGFENVGRVWSLPSPGGRRSVLSPTLRSNFPPAR